MRLWAALLLLMLGLNTLQADGLDYRLQPREVAPDTYVLEGGREHFSRENGGNIVNTAFIVTDAGVVVIDTGPSRLYGEQLRLAIAQVTDRPVERVYITHHHPDHFFGNQAFRDVPLLALPGTIAAAEAEGQTFSDNMYRLVGDWMRGTEPVVPTQAVEPGTVEVGGHRLELLALEGHSGADLAILDHTTGVLFASDLVFNRRAPTTPHADISAWLDSLEKIEQLGFEVLVPGHGPVVEGREPIAATADYLKWLAATVEQAARSGEAMAVLLHGEIPERFRDLAVLRPEYMRSIAHLFPRRERQVLGVPERGQSGE